MLETRPCCHLYSYDSSVGIEVQQFFAITPPFWPVSAVGGDQPFPFGAGPLLRKGAHVNLACARFIGGIRDPSVMDAKTRRAILFTSVIIFAFRATPSVGDGYFWWTLDVLKFDEGFYGALRQTAAVIGIVALWIFSKQLTGYSVTAVLLWLTVAGSVLALPNVGLFYGLHHWTMANFGFGERTIAIIDTVAGSPFAQLSMIPLLTLIALYAPAGRRATWFALMASLMNMALVAGQLQTKYLNQLFVVQRGDYSALGPLLIVAAVLGFILPIGAIFFFGRRA